MTVSVKRSALAIAGPMFRPIVPASIVGITCIPKIALGLGLANSPSSSIRSAPVRPPSGSPSSAGWNSISTVPGTCARIRDSSSATPSAMATWASCPQACFTLIHGGLVRHVDQLGNGQRVHVGAHGNHLARAPALEDADHAGLADACPDLVEPERAQPIGDERRRSASPGSRARDARGCRAASRRPSGADPRRCRSTSARWAARSDSVCAADVSAAASNNETMTACRRIRRL